MSHIITSDLHAQQDPQLYKFDVRDKIKLGLKNHVLDELIKILNVLTDVENFIYLVKYIDQNFYDHEHICQQKGNKYNQKIISMWG